MNALTLQRLVDNELTGEERAVFLRSLGNDVHQWRTLALQLIEDREFSRHVSKHGIDRRSASSCDSTHSDASSTQASIAPTPESLVHVHPILRFVNSPLLLSMAASLVLMAGGAFIAYRQQISHRAIQDAAPSLAGNHQPRANFDPAALTLAQTLEQPTEFKYTGLGDLVEAGRLQFVGDGSANELMEAPIYEVQALQPEMIFGDRQQLERLRTELLRSGWNIGVDTDVYGAELPDGRQMIVPIRNVSFEPYGI